MNVLFVVGNPVGGIAEMLSHDFIRYAFIAGGAIAVAAGIAGYFLVLRSQVFTGDALGHVAFTGALAALAFGVDLRVGLFTATVGVALLLGVLGPKGRADDVVIGSVFAWVLGLGVLFLSIFTRTRSGGGAGAAGIRILFGSIFGLDGSQTRLAVIVAVIVVVALLAIARPLLFASIDEAVAEARGVAVRGLGYVFLAIVGLAVAEASQAVGALLILGLMAAPAGAAQQLTCRPYLGVALSAAIALASVWIGLTLSHAIGTWPPSFAILAVATSFYALVLVLSAIRERIVRGARVAGNNGPARAEAAEGLSGGQ
jgi:zinc/manganese transport system permease protein